MLPEMTTFVPAPPAVVVLAPPKAEPQEPDRVAPWSLPRSRERLTAGLASFLLHLLVILLLAFCFSIPFTMPPEKTDLVLSIPESGPELSEIGNLNLESQASGGQTSDLLVGVPIEVEPQSETPITWQEISRKTSREPRELASTQLVSGDDLMMPSGVASGGGVEGRSAGMKGRLLATRGGSPESEDAVARGLKWLAVHQQRDGSWSFDHRHGPCHGYCRHPGSETSSTAATALALLPFFGAGHTQAEGEYQDLVQRGLFYLADRMVRNSQGGDFRGTSGDMYGQGLATLVFSEAYAMTGDEQLKNFAQAGLDFITAAQHAGGGWRYLPGQPGDTTVTGWQLMALKSGKLAGLEVSSSVIYRATHFLDSVAADDGATYGYQNNSARGACGAIGLYCRMLTGWNHYHPVLARGVENLAAQGPSPDDMYFNYYATMVLHHFDGPSWQPWNHQMRDRLVAEQAAGGHESGSWYYPHEYSKIGGRLYNTCMALVTLEVYYRYMPLYGLTGGVH
jgi:hypothetical protein